MVSLIFTKVSCPLTVLISLSESCTENEIQLNGGLLQICHESQWGLICSNPYLNYLNEAKVACRQLGLPLRGQIFIFYQHYIAIDTLCSSDTFSTTQMFVHSIMMHFILMVLPV